tara:strand:+ start:25846 stop:26265 length:420 start_codon:yes stop_codon:yes gene_type:complete
MIFTDSWAIQWANKLSSNEGYRVAASKWEGDIVLIMTKDPKLGVIEDLQVYLDLWHGECLSGRVAIEKDKIKSKYVIAAPAGEWKKILEGSLDPILALMRGKLILKKGSLSSMLPYVSAAKELVVSAKELDTDFPKEWK